MITSKKTRYIFITFILGLLFIAPQFTFAQSSSPTLFYVDPVFEETGATTEKILFLHSSQHAYFYVEKDYYDALSVSTQTNFQQRITTLAEQFDNKIYPSVRAVFGSEWTPGIDNDTRITIYFTDMPLDFNGYVRSVDEVNLPFVSNSNKREMIYINARLVRDARLPAVVAHEFQHLINLNEKVRLAGIVEDRWLNEGLSEYAVSVAGFSDVGNYLRSRVGALKNSPNTSLTVWDNSASDYAAASLFIHYLADVYGDTLISTIARSSTSGTRAISDALEKIGVGKTFSTVYAEWTVTLFLNQDIDGSGTYAYSNPMLDFLTLHIPARSTFDLQNTSSIKTSIALQDFSPQWYRFRPTQYDAQNSLFLHLEFTALEATDEFLLPIIVTDILGTVTVSFQKVSGASTILNIPAFNKQISSVVLIPASHTKLTGFDDSENKFRVLLTSASLRKNTVNIGEGGLVRAQGQNQVYIIKNNYRRWIQSEDIFDGYGQLRWGNVKEVNSTVLNTFEESFLIRIAGDYRVYEVTKDGVKHWLDMTASEFEASGRSWNAVYEVNQNEFNWHRTE